MFYSLKARAIANFGVCLRVRAFVGVLTTAFLSVVFYS
ncbi:putative membrane protein (plasmid) [Escherichia coli]|nr:putative membrane protein [Escherichia coli]